MAFTHLVFDGVPLPAMSLEFQAGVSLACHNGQMKLSAACTDEQAAGVMALGGPVAQLSMQASPDDRPHPPILDSQLKLKVGPLPAAGLPDGTWPLGNTQLSCRKGRLQLEVPVVREDLVALLAGGVRGFPERSGVEVLFAGGAMLGRLVTPRPPQHALEALAAHESALYASGLVRAFPPALPIDNPERVRELVLETLNGDLSLLEEARAESDEMAEMVRLEYCGLDHRAERLLMGHLQQAAVMFGERGGHMDTTADGAQWMRDAQLTAMHGLLVGSRLARTELALGGVDTSLEVSMPAVGGEHVPVGVVLPRMYLLEVTGDMRAQRIWSLPMEVARDVEMVMSLAIRQRFEEQYSSLEALQAVCFCGVDLGVRWQLARCAPQLLLGEN